METIAMIEECFNLIIPVGIITWAAVNLFDYYFKENDND